MFARFLLLLALFGSAIHPAFAQDIVVDEAAEEAFFRGVALLQAEAFADALIEFETALNLQPDLRRVHYYKALGHLRVGDFGLARRAADQYARFDLDEGESRQLDELRAELAVADPEGTTAVLPTRDVEEPEVEPTGPRIDAASALANAEQALGRGDCAEAVNGADMALRLDPGTSRAFVVKGRALFCVGEPARARSILLAYQELHGGRDATIDLETAKLMTEIETAIVASAGPAVPPAGGSDPAVQVVFGALLAPERGAIERRSEREVVPGVGITRTQRARVPLAGSRAYGTRSWVARKGQLEWVRVRIWGRRGSESPRWFQEGFAELSAEIQQSAGKPTQTAGFTPGGGDPVKALAGMEPYQARWQDSDGDVWQLRLGRCTTPGSRGHALVENAPCLELLGHVGGWEPRGDGDAAHAEATARSEEPGLRLPDFSVSILGALPTPSAWVGREGTTASGASAPGAAFGGGVLTRFAFEGLAWGVGYQFSAATALNFTDAPFFFENRLVFYVGARFGPRQPSSFDVLFGIGVSPEASGAYPSLGLRFVGSVRTDRRGRFVMSVEPHVVISDRYLTIVPFRFTIGGAVGTTPGAASRR